MPIRKSKVCLAVAAVFAVAVLSSAMAGAQDTTIGKFTYEDRCAVCHGVLGHGNGPMAGALTPPPSNLTLLAKQSGGEYPFAQVYEVIDGRTSVTGHGSRQMPVWGSHFKTEQSPALRFPGIDPEEIVQARIFGLVYYIQTLQVK